MMSNSYAQFQDFINVPRTCIHKANMSPLINSATEDLII